MNTIAKEFNDIHVMIVDDYFINREILNDMLTLMGCNVTVADSGTKALELFHELTFDVIFLDVKMPAPDGYQVTKEIRNIQKQLSKEKQTPIVAITANALEHDRQICLDAGMDDYIAKPIKSKDLSTIIKKWVHTLDE